MDNLADFLAYVEWVKKLCIEMETELIAQGDSRTLGSESLIIYPLRKAVGLQSREAYISFEICEKG